MALSKTTILIVALLFFTPLLTVSQATIPDSDIPQNIKSDISKGEWILINDATINDYPLRESSGYIHSPFIFLRS